MLFRFGWLALCALAVCRVQGGELRVSLSPEKIYTGDAIRLEVAAEETLQAVDFTFSMPTQTIGRSQNLQVINGRASSSISFRVLPTGEGTCRLERLTARTQSGKTLTFDEHPQVEIQKLEQDPDVSLTLSVEPESPLPGDDVTLRIRVRAPSLEYDGSAHSPFYSTDLFGRLTERLPKVGFQNMTEDDSPLKLTGNPTAEPTRTEEGGAMVWEIAIPYKAVRTGVQTFPAPIINDRRIAKLDAKGNPTWVRTLAQGNALSVKVVPPPEEGRPKCFTGAIGNAFSAEAVLDAHNVNVGDPVTLTLRFTTDGDTSLIREPAFTAPPGFRLYGEATRTRFEGGCAFALHVRPIRAGLLEIPPLDFAWFDRASATYRTVHTSAIPLHARPSAQLALLGEDGTQTLSALPPPLTFASGAQPKRTPAPWALGVLVLGMACVALRLAVRPAKVIFKVLATPFAKRRPTARALASLRSATSPAEAAGAIRLWAGRPALTAEELKGVLAQGEATPERLEFVKAYAELEASTYTGSAEWTSARDKLVALLPRVPRPPSAGHRVAKGAGLVLALLLLPATLSAAPDAFLREQAEAASIQATTTADYARAANLWLRVAREGELSRAVLLNASTCALLARRPAEAVAVVDLCRWAHGSDEATQQALVAAYTAQERTVPFWAKVFPPPGGVRTLLDVLCMSLGALLLLLAIPGRKLLLLRVAMSTFLLLVGILAGVAFLRVSPKALPPEIPVAVEGEAQP